MSTSTSTIIVVVTIIIVVILSGNAWLDFLGGYPLELERRRED